jgi:membrane protease YdiL (CAAX protease family)
LHKGISVVSQLSPREPASQLDGPLVEKTVESRKGSTRRAWLAMVVGLLLAYSPPIARFFSAVENALVSLTSISDVSAWTLGVVAYQIAIVLLILGIIRFWERRPFSSAGFRRLSLADISVAVFVWIVSVWVEVATRQLHLSPFFTPKLSAHPPQQSFHLMLVSFPEWTRISLIVGNSFYEEVGRGYAIERLTETTGSLYAAGFLALLFSLGMHAYAGGAENILVYLPIQLSLVLLYLWRRNTIACVLSHTLANGFNLIVWYLLPISANHLLHRLGF